MILYLTLEGVLLPMDYLDDIEQQVEFDTHRVALLGTGSTLAAALEPFSGIDIVLNTWWTYYIGACECRKLLPKALGRRVIGSVLVRPSRYDAVPDRPLATQNHIRTNGHSRVLILDHIHARYCAQFLRYTLLIHDVTRWQDLHLIHVLQHRLRKLTQVPKRIEGGVPSDRATSANRAKDLV
jgi:hypothetical protein